MRAPMSVSTPRSRTEVPPTSVTASWFTYGAQAVWQMYVPRSQLAFAWLYMDPRLEQPANEPWRDALR